jgi:hypothetical protein
MATIYYRLIKKGLKSLDDVPERYKAEVVKLLESEDKQ